MQMKKEKSVRKATFTDWASGSELQFGFNGDLSCVHPERKLHCLYYALVFSEEKTENERESERESGHKCAERGAEEKELYWIDELCACMAISEYVIQSRCRLHHTAPGRKASLSEELAW